MYFNLNKFENSLYYHINHYYIYYELKDVLQNIYLKKMRLFVTLFSISSINVYRDKFYPHQVLM